MHYYHSYTIALLTTAAIIYVLKHQAIRIGLVDHPDARKDHLVETPLVGGLAIFCGFLVSLTMFDIALNSQGVFISAGLILIVMGVLDDFFNISPTLRFAVQIVVGLLMALWGGVKLYDLGTLSFDGSLFYLGALAVPFTVFAMVGVTNALNMSDGMDGQAASLTLSALLGLVVVTYVSGQYETMSILLLLASGVMAFWAFNIRLPWKSRASVFLGDAGSMFLGFALVWFMISLSQGELSAMQPVTALWFLMVPLNDTVGIMVRRIWKGRSPFQADREHFHHLLLFAGYSVTQSVLILTGLALVGVMIGLGGWFLAVPDILMFAAFLGLSALYFWNMMHAWKTMRFFGRSICRRRSSREPRSGWNPRVAVTNVIQIMRGSDRRASVTGQYSAAFPVALLAHPCAFSELDPRGRNPLRKFQ